MEKIFSLKLFSSISMIPSSINLCENSYTCQIKSLFSAQFGSFPSEWQRTIIELVVLNLDWKKIGPNLISPQSLWDH